MRWKISRIGRATERFHACLLNDMRHGKNRIREIVGCGYAFKQRYGSKSFVRFKPDSNNMCSTLKR